MCVFWSLIFKFEIGLKFGIDRLSTKASSVMRSMCVYIIYACILYTYFIFNVRKNVSRLTFFFLMLQEVVTDLMRQIQELRSSINHKTESIDGLTRELEDINVCSVILKDMVSFLRNGRQWHVLSWVSNSITCCSVLERNFFVLTCWNLLNILCLRLSCKLNSFHVVGKEQCL